MHDPVTERHEVLPACCIEMAANMDLSINQGQITLIKITQSNKKQEICVYETRMPPMDAAVVSHKRMEKLWPR